MWQAVIFFFFSGIPWIFDIISAVLSHAYGVGKSFEVRLTLDIMNLLTVIFALLLILSGHQDDSYFREF